MVGSDEEALLKFQWGRRMGMFQCTGWEVVSDQRVRIGGPGEEGFETTLLPGGLHDQRGTWGVACSETNGFLNSFTFMNVWLLLIKQERVWEHDFILKVDVDAVVFPFRFPSIMNPWRGKAVVFANRPNGRLWGAVEAFSREALARYAADLNLTGRKDNEPAIPQRCKGMPWWCWGEDEFMQQCVKAQGVPSPYVPNLVLEGWGNINCGDPSKAAFHHYKDVWQQEQCLKMAGAW